MATQVRCVLRGNAGIIAAVALCGVASCTTTSSIQPAELARLDGYEASRTPPSSSELEVIGGGRVSFRQDSDLYLTLPGDRVGGRFESIRVHDGLFEGQTRSGDQIRVPTGEIKAARVDQPDNGTTLAVVGSVLLALFAAGVYLVAHDQSGARPVSGRPLRIGRKITTAAPRAAREGRDVGPVPDTALISPETRAALADAWTTSALSEHASVPAFARLSMTLTALGAPLDLVERVHRAAIEEIEHTRRSFALAESYAGKSIEPGPLPELRQASAVTATSVSELARESLIDGCLLEGTAAAVAELGSVRARDPAVREVLATIARDESSHAELAWEILGWCWMQAEIELGWELVDLAQKARSPIAVAATPAALEAELAAHGWLGGRVWNEQFERTRAATVARLTALISGTPISAGVTSTSPAVAA